jgi:beta-ureidopropionase
MSVVGAVIAPTPWPGDKESMLARHGIRPGGTAGAQTICFQELFHSPYFRSVPDARIAFNARRDDLAKPANGPAITASQLRPPRWAW